MHRRETDTSADALARRGSRDVLDDAVALYLRAPSHEKGEIRAFAALVDGLLDGAGPAERRRVALALAPRADTPPEIARRLATDSIDVAEAMIERSPVLTSSDLVEIMRCGPAHVGCVGRRLDLAPDVAAVLIDTSVARPDGAPVVSGARRRSDRPAAAPPRDADPELPAEAAAPAAPTSAHTRSDTPFFRVPLRESAPATRTQPAATAVPTPDATSAGPRLPDVTAFLALDSAGRWRALQTAALEAAVHVVPTRDPAADAGLLGERLLAAIVADDRTFFADALRGHLGLGAEQMEAVLDEPSGEALAIVLVAAGVGEIRTTSILLHHLGSRATLGALQDLVALVERTARRTAERLVMAWRDPPARRGGPLRQTDPAERRPSAGAARSTGVAEVRPTSETSRTGG